MQISIAMATYNGARFLREQLASITAQTTLPAELVVSDDGSTDDTIEIIKEFRQTSKFPVRILDKTERLGFSDNFLYAAEACRNPIIAFCDQDDVWLPKKLQVGLDRLQSDSSLLSLHRLTLTNDALQPYGTFDQEIERDAVFDALDLDPHITGWGNTMLFRQELVALIPRAKRPRHPETQQRPLTHDTWVYTLAAALGRVSHIHEPLILYRQHAQNAAGAQRTSFLRRLAIRGAVSMTRIREQMIFADRMSVLLGEYGEQHSDVLGEAAQRAGLEFARRRDRTAARIRVYNGASALHRLRAYQEMRRIPLHREITAGSFAKDLVLGVIGMHAFLPPHPLESKVNP